MQYASLASTGQHPVNPLDWCDDIVTSHKRNWCEQLILKKKHLTNLCPGFQATQQPPGSHCRAGPTQPVGSCNYWWPANLRNQSLTCPDTATMSPAHLTLNRERDLYGQPQDASIRKYRTTISGVSGSRPSMPTDTSILFEHVVQPACVDVGSTKLFEILILRAQFRRNVKSLIKCKVESVLCTPSRACWPFMQGELKLITYFRIESVYNL